MTRQLGDYIVRQREDDRKLTEIFTIHKVMCYIRSKHRHESLSDARIPIENCQRKKERRQ